jgi:ABC-type lipoprotein export system ATPase subunit
MVTHDLRMCRYVDKIIQIRDGKIDSVIDNRQQIDELIHG